jgi:NhaA family Na+:H+ antiporter
MSTSKRHGQSAAASQTLPIDAILNPLQSFAQHKLAGAGLLMAATVVALVWANSPWVDVYEHILHLELEVSIAGQVFAQSVHDLINDGLMAVFFLLVGLEIKRELLIGELSTVRMAALPALAALGGMIAPALLYVAVNPDAPLRHGWGIPMATDIAFALGVLAVVGSRAPTGLKIFLTALAIVDDIGAVLVIAIFYTEQVVVVALLVGLAGVALSVVMNVLGVRSPISYFLLGAVVWLAFLESGVHATVAALLLAFSIPSRTRIDGKRLATQLQRALDKLHRVGLPSDKGLNTNEQQRVMDEIAMLRGAATAPLQNLEHALSPVVTFLILPIFALANAGVSLSGVGIDALSGGIALGVIVGLVLGKPLGIVAFTWLGVRLGLADLPEGVNWRHVVGVGLLGGIGFTMALFIAGLAFSSAAELEVAKVGILFASGLAGIGGLLILRVGAKD